MRCPPKSPARSACRAIQTPHHSAELKRKPSTAPHSSRMGTGALANHRAVSCTAASAEHDRTPRSFRERRYPVHSIVALPGPLAVLCIANRICVPTGSVDAHAPYLCTDTAQSTSSPLRCPKPKSEKTLKNVSFLRLAVLLNTFGSFQDRQSTLDTARFISIYTKSYIRDRKNRLGRKINRTL